MHYGYCYPYYYSSKKNHEKFFFIKQKTAYEMTGQYEKVLPMDLLPVFLIKSIIAKDIDKMEQLGIYEVIEEDLALCEFVCTSKTEVQHLLREGISLMIKELGN